MCQKHLKCSYLFLGNFTSGIYPKEKNLHAEESYAQRHSFWFTYNNEEIGTKQEGKLQWASYNTKVVTMTAIGRQSCLGEWEDEKDLVRRKDKNKYVLSIYHRISTILGILCTLSHFSLTQYMLPVGFPNEAGRVNTMEDPLLNTRHCDICRKSGFIHEPH